MGKPPHHLLAEVVEGEEESFDQAQRLKLEMGMLDQAFLLLPRVETWALGSAPHGTIVVEEQ